MKVTITITLIILVHFFGFAQPPKNTWVSGSAEFDQAGVYGTLGVPNANNMPGSRNASASWTDNTGNLWLFGGYGLDAAGDLGNLNDMWKYNTASNEWAWIGGSNLVEGGGVQGPKGVGSTSYIPPPKRYAVTWTDNSGKFWLFGGNGNSLWLFDPSNGEWAWMGGDGGVNYGSLGLGSVNNIPGSRSSAVSWADLSGNLWLFGGNGFDKNGFQGSLNDLWHYNISSEEWTWVSGSDVANQVGIYGAKGTGSTSNIPGARYRHNSWLGPAGKLWLFGGRDDLEEEGFAPVFFNDLWQYDPTSKEWSWVSGSDSTVPQQGLYGEKGISSITNHPGTREHATSWADDLGNLWLFGGWGFDGTGSSGSLNDFWLYQPAVGEWIWMDGSDIINQSGDYGTKGTSGLENSPGARLDATPWNDVNGNLWLFGGEYLWEGRHNDLWKINTYIWYADVDQDTFGNPLSSLTQYIPPLDHVLDNTDCDDTNSAINPQGTDIGGSGVDSNCDGQYIWYADEDNDGFAGTETMSANSSPDLGEFSASTDCDDSDADVYPDAPTLPDGKDNDCDGVIDKVAQTITFNELLDKVDGSGTITLEATSSSMLGVLYNVTGPATVDGSILTLTGAGTVSITASQEGNDGYLPAENVMQSFCVNPQPSVTTTLNGLGSLTLSSNYDIGNQWYLNNEPVTTATSQQYIIDQGGIFNLEVTIDGCNGISDNIEVLLTDINKELSPKELTIYPMPLANTMNINTKDLPFGNYTLSIVDVSGKIHMFKNISVNESNSKHRIGLEKIDRGTYIVIMRHNNEQFIQKIIKH